MKIAKWMLCVAILLFAGYGVKSLFFPRKPANEISAGDAAVLRELGIDIDPNADPNGTSPVFGYVNFSESSETGSMPEMFGGVGEAPPFGSSEGQSAETPSTGVQRTATAGPPFEVGISDAPPSPFDTPVAAVPAPSYGAQYGSQVNGSKPVAEAPALGAAPPFSPESVPTTAPPFHSVPTTAPLFEQPPSPFEDTRTPSPPSPVLEGTMPETTTLFPTAHPTATDSSMTTPMPEGKSDSETISPAETPAAADVAIDTVTDTVADTKASLQDVAVLHDIPVLADIPVNQGSLWDSAEKTPVKTPVASSGVASSGVASSGIVASGVASSNEDEQHAEPQPVFTQPKVKSLPQVTEEGPTLAVRPNPSRKLPQQPSASESWQASESLQANELVPVDYRQTSGRVDHLPPEPLQPVPSRPGPSQREIVPVRPDPVPPAADMVSTMHFDVAPTNSVAFKMDAPAVDAPAADFPATAIPAQEPAASSTTPAQRESMQRESVLRESVANYVKAQCSLIDSGTIGAVCEGFDCLSQLNDMKDLNANERSYLAPILDKLANDVIFTPEIHVLEPPYRVEPNDTIESVARKFDLNPETLMRINGIARHRVLIPGSELKVVRGPFDAKIFLDRKELQIILGGLYVGRRPVVIGESLHGQEGEFLVQEKRAVGPAAQHRWIGLGGGKGITNSDNPSAPHPNPLVFVPSVEMNELFDLLSDKSTITITK